MTTVTSSTPTKPTTQNEYADGKFDAALGYAPKSLNGDYFRGYAAYTLETGKAPF